MSSPRGFNTKSPTIKRILQESRELSASPDPTLTAAPLESNLFEWHFTLTGPPSTPYESGIYHGRIVLPPTYPLRPPSFRFLTPSGRFETNREICLSISGHHEETWQPAWGIRTALCAIRAFMAGDAKGQVGGLDMSAEGRERLARESRSWKCTAGCGSGTNEEVMKEVEAEWKKNGGGQDGKQTTSKIPEELRLAFREDLEKEKSESEKGKGVEKSEDGGKQAENKQATSSMSGVSVPLVSASSSSQAAATTAATTTGASHTGRTGSRSRAASSQLTARPTSTTVGAARQRVTMEATSGHNNNNNNLPRQEDIPAWVDKAIAIVIVALVVMLLKKLAAVGEY